MPSEGTWRGDSGQQTGPLPSPFKEKQLKYKGYGEGEEEIKTDRWVQASASHLEEEEFGCRSPLRSLATLAFAS